MKDEARLRAELKRLQRQRLMLSFAIAGELWRDESVLPTDPWRALALLDGVTSLEILEQEAERVALRDAAIRDHLAAQRESLAPPKTRRRPTTRASP